MALTDNRTQLNDCEDDAQTFTTSGAQLGTSTLSGQFVEGAASVQAQHSNTYDDTYTSGDSAGATFSLDFSDTTVYLGVKDNLMALDSVAGGMIVLGDGTDRIGYTIGGSNAVGLPYANQYIFFKLDGSDAVANPGTADVDHHVFAGTEANLTFTAITIMGFGSLHNAKAQGNVPNVFLDNFRYIANGSIAASITGGTIGTPEGMADVVIDDETVGAGMFANPLGEQYIIFAPTEWGDDTTLDSYFVGVDQQWVFMGDNSGSRAIGLGNFPMQVVGNGTGTNSFVLTRVVAVSTGARASLDMSDVNVDIMQLDSCVFTDLGLITMPIQVVDDKFCNTSVFNNCDQMILATLDMDNCTWNGTTDADGAFAWGTVEQDQEKQINSTLVSDGTGNAIEINPTGAGPFTYAVEGLTVDGYATQLGTAADRVFYINPATLSADININLTNGQAVNPIGGGTENFSYRVVGSYTGTVTISNTVTLTVQVDDSAGNPVEGASVRIELSSDGSLVADGTTNASGTFTDSSFNFSTDTDVLTKVRLKGFKSFRTGGTIISTGLTVGVTFQADKIVDLP